MTPPSLLLLCAFMVQNTNFLLGHVPTSLRKRRSCGYPQVRPLFVLCTFMQKPLFFNVIRVNCISSYPQNTLFKGYFTKVFLEVIIYISLVDTPQNRVCLEDEHAIFRTMYCRTWLYRELSQMMILLRNSCHKSAPNTRGFEYNYTIQLFL